MTGIIRDATPQELAPDSKGEKLVLIADSKGNIPDEQAKEKQARAKIFDLFMNRSRKLIHESEDPIKTIRDGEIPCPKCFKLEHKEGVNGLAEDDFKKNWEEYKLTLISKEPRLKLLDIHLSKKKDIHGHLYESIIFKLGCRCQNLKKIVTHSIDKEEVLSKELWDKMLISVRKFEEEE